MSPPMPKAMIPTASFPRVSGDEPLGSCGGSQEPEFSPRERG